MSHRIAFTFRLYCWVTCLAVGSSTMLLSSSPSISAGDGGGGGIPCNSNHRHTHSHSHHSPPQWTSTSSRSPLPRLSSRHRRSCSSLSSALPRSVLFKTRRSQMRIHISNETKLNKNVILTYHPPLDFISERNDIYIHSHPPPTYYHHLPIEISSSILISALGSCSWFNYRRGL